MQYRDPEICRNGLHRYDEVGRRNDGRCAECSRTNNRNAVRRRLGTAHDIDRRDPQKIPNLRKVREDLGLSLRELARRAGLSPSHLGKLERGMNGATVTTRERILRAVTIAVHEKRERAKRKGKI